MKTSGVTKQIFRFIYLGKAKTIISPPPPGYIAMTSPKRIQYTDKIGPKTYIKVHTI